MQESVGKCRRLQKSPFHRPGREQAYHRPFHLVLDGPNRLLHIEMRASEAGFLLPEVVELLLDLDLQLEFVLETRHLRVDARIFQAS